MPLSDALLYAVHAALGDRPVTGWHGDQTDYARARHTITSVLAQQSIALTDAASLSMAEAVQIVQVRFAAWTMDMQVAIVMQEIAP